jgi:predicted Zn-dependent peptidase
MKTRKQSVQIKTIHGYTVLLAPCPIDTIAVRAVVRTGFIHETMNNAGIHHLLEHVAVDGWKNCNSNCIQYWNKKGCTMNATTSNTEVNYFVKGLPDMAEEMVQYISTIVTTARLSEEVMRREKKAVISELSMIMNCPKYELSNVFNQSFYVPEGLQHMDDAKLQIKNVDTLTLSMLKEAHQKMYTPDSVVFVVYGNFSVPEITKLLTSYLPTSRPVDLPPFDCFSYRHDLLYVHKNSPTVTVIVGFPMKTLWNERDLYQHVLKTILFEELRTKHNLVYGVTVTVNQDHCSSSLMIEFECLPEVFVKTLHILFHQLLDCTRTLIDPEILIGQQRKMIYTYHTKYDYDVYYSTYAYHKRAMYTKRQLIRKIQESTVQSFRSFMKEAIVLPQCTLAYQGKKNFHLDWDMFKIDAPRK